MKVAIVGSRGLIFNDFHKFIPVETSEIVSGGCKGIDTCAKKYAVANNIKLTEFLPNYRLYGRAAPLKRNMKIVDYSDYVIAFHDGVSRGTLHVIDYCKKMDVPVKIVVMVSDSDV